MSIRGTRAPALPSASPSAAAGTSSPAGKKAVNRAHAKIRALGEQAMATLKSWRLVRKLRSSTTRITDLVKAVLTLEPTAST